MGLRLKKELWAGNVQAIYTERGKPHRWIKQKQKQKTIGKSYSKSTTNP